MAKNNVEPRTLKGFVDLLPEELASRKAVIATIEAVFQRFGFAPLETPALEYLDVLLGTGGENTNKELFRLESPEGEPIALRFDLTVPFARVLAQYPDRLKPPFRRYAIGPVWRADKPAPGRFRQFTQFDIDAAGSDSVAIDAEIIAVMTEVMAALSIPGYTVLVNNRKLIDALLDGLGITELERKKHVLRVIDKLAKVGIENIRLELAGGRVDDSGDPIPGVGLDGATIDALLAFIAVDGETRAEVVDRLAAALPDSPAANSAIDDMRQLDACLAALGVAESDARFDPSLARGLDYYTGPVFEMVITDAPQFGSVMGGGRYDGLVARFLDRPIPATGMAVGLDRLLSAMAYLGLDHKAPSHIDVLVVTIGRVPLPETLRLAAELRAAGFRTESYIASRKKMSMGSQLSHANHYNVPVAVIIGEDELAQGLVSVKNLQEGKDARENIEDREAYLAAGKTGQVTIARTEMVEVIKAMLQQ